MTGTVFPSPLDAADTVLPTLVTAFATIVTTGANGLPVPVGAGLGAGGVGDVGVTGDGDGAADGAVGATVTVVPGGTSTSTEVAGVVTLPAVTTATRTDTAEPAALPTDTAAVTGRVVVAGPVVGGAKFVPLFRPPPGCVVGPCAERPVGRLCEVPAAKPAATSAAAAIPLTAATTRVRLGSERQPPVTTAGSADARNGVLRRSRFPTRHEGPKSRER
jgi:hypothetical protein